MTPAQAVMCLEVRGLMAEFYRNPENEKEFQTWRSSRQEGGASQPASERRAPERPAAGPGTW